MVEEAVFVGHAVPQKIERGLHACHDFVAISISARIADAQRCESKSRGSDAGNSPSIVSARKAAVADLTGGRICVFPEKIESSSFDLLERVVIRIGCQFSGRVVHVLAEGLEISVARAARSDFLVYDEAACRRLHEKHFVDQAVPSAAKHASSFRLVRKYRLRCRHDCPDCEV